MIPSRVTLVFAHPDDESFMMGGTVRKLMEHGYHVSLYTATSGDAGKYGHLQFVSREQYAQKRREELHNACDHLGIESLSIGPFLDKGLSSLPEGVLVAAIRNEIIKTRAQIVFTFPEDGFSFHPDHTAISKAVFAAVPTIPDVEKLYVGASPQETLRHRATTSLDITSQRKAKMNALLAHETQIFSVERVYPNLSTQYEACLSSTEQFILAWQLGQWWPTVSETETDFFV